MYFSTTSFHGRLKREVQGRTTEEKNISRASKSSHLGVPWVLYTHIAEGDLSNLEKGVHAKLLGLIDEVRAEFEMKADLQLVGVEKQSDE